MCCGSVMEGEESLPLYSPEYMVMSPSFKDAVPLLPPITLFHGMTDYSIPHEARYYRGTEILYSMLGRHFEFSLLYPFFLS